MSTFLIRVRPRAAAGQFLRYGCIGPDQYRILSDGNGGEYAVLDNPATAQLVRYDCVGSNRFAVRRNGTCAEFRAEAADTGSFVRQQCFDDGLYAIRQNGTCGEYQAELIEPCSPLCGCGGNGGPSYDCGSCCGSYPNCYSCGGPRAGSRVGLSDTLCLPNILV